MKNTSKPLTLPPCLIHGMLLLNISGCFSEILASFSSAVALKSLVFTSVGVVIRRVELMI